MTPQIPQPIQQTRNRFEQALLIQAGASNGRGVARALVKAYDEAATETGSTFDSNHDPAVQMILHQLCHLGGIPTCEASRRNGGFDWRAAYRECMERCQSYKTLVLLDEIDQACLFVCDAPHYDM
jgi:hypothetical protein